MARLVGVFTGRKGKTGEIPALFVHCRRTRRKELRHGGGAVRLEIRYYPPKQRDWNLSGRVGLEGKVNKKAVAGVFKDRPGNDRLEIQQRGP